MTNFSNIRPPSIRSIMRSRALKAAVKALRGIEEPKMRGKTKHPSWQSALICAVSMMAGGAGMSVGESTDRRTGKAAR